MSMIVVRAKTRSREPHQNPVPCDQRGFDVETSRIGRRRKKRKKTLQRQERHMAQAPERREQRKKEQDEHRLSKSAGSFFLR